MINIKSIIGSNYGDEGKGYMTDYFASQNEGNVIVVCNNGGSQKGHTVETNNGKRHIFHHFGSGCFAKADTFLAKDFILNPMIFCQEYQELKKLNIITKTFISNKCRFSTPFDMMLNQVLEIHRGNNRYGSCGYGIWETVIRYREDNRFIDIETASKMTQKELYNYILMCKEYSTNRMKNLYSIDITKYSQWNDLWDNDNIILNYIDDFYTMMQIVTITKHNKVLNNYENIVFENSQGLLLDQSKKEYINNTTPSNTGIKAMVEVLKEWENEEEKQLEVCYVSRSYLTKHGAGDFPHECSKEQINRDMVDETNVPNPYQGTLRYGVLDVEELIERIDEDFNILIQENFNKLNVTKSIAITHLNEYKLGYDGFINRVNTIYNSNGKTRESLVKAFA